MLNALKNYKNSKITSVFPYLLLFCFVIGFCWLFCLKDGVFGSKIDWISQHSVFPDYFRKQFYETGNFFPEFAANIGGGQNIYHFSYYGLYSPIILISYLLPFVKMSDYMMGAQIICLVLSVFLFYFWLEKRKIPKKICFGTAALFLLSAPMIFHSYNQIMFVNYMPFLCMSFLGADRYFSSGHQHFKDSVLLVAGVFLMIMTSFYFSIGGILALSIYGIYRYLSVSAEKEETVTAGSFLKEGILFAARLLLSILMSGVLLAPTFYALAGREKSGISIDMKQLFFPVFHAQEFLYSSYGLGLTTLVITALFSLLLFFQMREKILSGLCLIILTVPFFSFCLNGGLYIRDKVMLPFLPLLCYMIALYLQWIENRTKKADLKKGAAKFFYSFAPYFPYVMTIILLIFSCGNAVRAQKWEWILADACLMPVFFWAAKKKKNAVFLLLPALIFLAGYGKVYHEQMNRMLPEDFYKKVTDQSIEKLMAEILAEEEGFYRMEQYGMPEENEANLNRIWNQQQYSSSIYSSGFHKEYDNFRKHIFQTEQPFRNCLMQSASANPVFRRVMGEKYILSQKEVPGYKKIEDWAGWGVYENSAVSPVIYVSDKTISEETYQKFRFPYNQLALLSYGVTSPRLNKTENAGETKGIVKRLKDEYQLRDISKYMNEKLKTARWIKQKSSGFEIKTPSEKKWKLRMKDIFEENQREGQGEKVLFLQFRIKNLRPEEDVSLWVNEEKNTLTAKSHYYYNENTTFTFAVSLGENKKAGKKYNLSLRFGKGTYQISQVKCYAGVLPQQTARSGALYQSAFFLDKARTKGNVIEGKIDAKKGQYMITTIPYEENFEIYIDGKKEKSEKMNETFLGCRIKEGEHRIKIIYHAPGALEGKILSFLGGAFFLGEGILEKIKKGNRRGKRKLLMV